MSQLRKGILSLVVSLIASHPAVSANGYWILGIGNDSCGQWTASRSRGNSVVREPLILSWLQGWLSAESVTVSFASNGKQYLKSTYKDALASWLDNYCKAHPLNTIDDAALVLDEKLLRHN